MGESAENNMLSYETIGWIMNYSDEGFFIMVASREMQDIVVDNYEFPDVAVLDCIKLTDKTYSFKTIASWIEGQPDKKVYFLKHFDAVVQDDFSIARLNFSRDMLASMEKNIIFCITQVTDDKMNKKAIDFYSFVKFRMPFEDEQKYIKDDVFIETDIPAAEEAEKPELRTDIEIDYTQSDRKLLTKAISYMNVANVELQNNEFKKALNHLAAAYQIRMKLLGYWHSATADTCDKIGALYKETGHYNDALHFYQMALEIKKQVLDNEHPSMAATYNNLARVYRAQGDYEKALEYYGKALDISERVLGREHPDTARTYNNLAGLYEDQGDYEKALKYYGKALDICERVLGTEHPDTARTYNNLALVYQDRGDYEKALEYFGKALNVYLTVFGENHPGTKIIRKNQNALLKY